MNYLGIDYGEKKIGLAFSAGEFAKPYQVLLISGVKYQVSSIKEICKEENVGQIVVGFPEQDKDSSTVHKIKDFVQELEKSVKIPVVFQDETLSSQKALQKMIEAGKGKRKRQQEDAFAAAVILQECLDKLKVKS